MNKLFFIPEELRGSVVAVRILDIAQDIEEENSVSDGRSVGLGIIWETGPGMDPNALNVLAELRQISGEAVQDAG